MNDFTWTGRTDGPGPEHDRWHSVITSGGEVPEGAVALLGFASDEGVRRNHGRVGAAAGPDAIREQLAGLAVHDDVPRHDLGTIVSGADLEAGQEELAQVVERALGPAGTVVVMGGGHETSYGSHLGLHRWAAPNERIAIVNLDAHFDLRRAEQATSGTLFLQISELERPFDYSVWGISWPNNTTALLDTADRLGVHYYSDEELVRAGFDTATEKLQALVAEADHIHLSIDLDVLPAATAPGVSAPAAFGVSFAMVQALVDAALGTGKVRLVDVVELNPHYDIDGRTAKVAARLIDDVATAD